MRDLRKYFDFVDFGEICRDCRENCCKRFYAVLLPDEEHEFADFSDEVETPEGRVRTLGSPRGKQCPFLDQRGWCTIYPRRPYDCRTWPILLYYDIERREKVAYLDLDCPAAAQGRIPKELVDRIIETYKRLDVDESWLKRFTLAPWPNNLVELARWR
ncbi:MAG: YkgJ family cysteine cluster protein [Fervidicoccaceae archaeon]